MRNSCGCTQADFDIAVLDGLSYIAGVYLVFIGVCILSLFCARCFLLLVWCVRHDAWCCIVCAQSCMQLAGLVSHGRRGPASSEDFRGAFAKKERVRDLFGVVDVVG